LILKKIEKLLKEFFDEEYISFNDDVIQFPLGHFCIEEPYGWTFSADYTFCMEMNYIQMLFIILQKINTKNIKIEIFEPYFSIVKDESIYVGIIFNHDINKKMKKLGIDYESAKNILEGKIMNDYNKSIIKKENVI